MPKRGRWSRANRQFALLHRRADRGHHKRMAKFLRLIDSLIIVALAGIIGCSAKAASRMPIPAAQQDIPLATATGRQTAVFAGGCFWGTQAVFERVKGVITTTAGYSGGSAATATYD